MTGKIEFAGACAFIDLYSPLTLFLSAQTSPTLGEGEKSKKKPPTKKK